MQNIYCTSRITLISTLLCLTGATASENQPKTSATQLISQIQATAAALAKTTLRAQAHFPIDYMHHSNINFTSPTTLQIERAGLVYLASGAVDASRTPAKGLVDFQQVQEEYEFSLTTPLIRKVSKSESAIFWPSYHGAIQRIAVNNAGAHNNLDILREKFGTIIPANYASGCATSSQHLVATADRDGTIKIYTIDE